MRAFSTAFSSAFKEKAKITHVPKLLNSSLDTRVGRGVINNLCKVAKRARDLLSGCYSLWRRRCKKCLSPEDLPRQRTDRQRTTIKSDRILKLLMSLSVGSFCRVAGVFIFIHLWGHLTGLSSLFFCSPRFSCSGRVWVSIAGRKWDLAQCPTPSFFSTWTLLLPNLGLCDSNFFFLFFLFVNDWKYNIIQHFKHKLLYFK